METNANSFLSSSFYRCSTSPNKMKGNYLSLCFINSFSVVKPIMVDAISRKSIALASRLKKAISISTINSRSSIFFASRDSTMIWLHIRLWKLYPRTSIAWSFGSYRRNKNLIRRCLTKSFCWYQGTLLFEGNIVSVLHFSNPREDTMLLS